MQPLALQQFQLIKMNNEIIHPPSLSHSANPGDYLSQIPNWIHGRFGIHIYINIYIYMYVCIQDRMDVQLPTALGKALRFSALEKLS